MIEHLLELLEEFHIKPKDISLYEMAFTHPSYSNEHPGCPSYDRLEFLGDSLLDMIVGDMVYQHYPKSNSGKLSMARSALVDGKTLSRLSESVYGFADLVRYSVGEAKNIHHHSHVNEDVFEAFIAAVYLDQGYEKVRDIVVSIFDPLLEMALEVSQVRDTKGRLQAYMNGTNIEYVVISPKNINTDDVSYVVEARIGEDVLGVGEGHNKKEAEINAARDALSKKVGD
jgi:hypothetical protein